MNLLALLLAIIMLVVLRGWFVPSGWLLVAGGAIAVLAGCFVIASIMLQRGWLQSSIALIVLSSWGVELAVVAVAPVAAVILPLAVLLPALLVVPYVPPDRLRAIFGSALVVEIIVGLVGRLHVGVGLEALAPAWAINVLIITFVPITAALAVSAAWRNHTLLVNRVEELARSRERMLTAVDRERNRMEHALLEETVPLVAAARARVDAARAAVAGGGLRACGTLGVIAAELRTATARLRDIAHGIWPPELRERGIAAALRTMTSSGRMRVSVVGDGLPRRPSSVEAAVYFCCLETIRFMATHAGPNVSITVSLVERAGRERGLAFVVENSGSGEPANFASEGELTLLRDRLGAVGGTIQFDSRPDRGTAVHGFVPDEPVQDMRSSVGGRLVEVGLAAVWDLARRIVGATDSSGSANLISAGMQAQLVPCAGTVVVQLMLYFLLGRPPGLFVLTALSLVAFGVFIFAKRASDGGRDTRALLLATPTIWIYAAVVVLLYPPGLPHSAVLAAVPIVLAIAHVRQHFRPIMMGTVICAAAVAVGGRLSPGAGLEYIGPPWLVTTAIVTFIAVNATVLLFVASLNHLALALRTTQLRASRSRIVAAADRERREIERNLHDGAQQRLVAASIQASLAKRVVDKAPTRIGILLDNLADDLGHADAELRTLARGIYPEILAERGLAAAVTAVAARTPLPTVINASGIRRYGPDVELQLYYCCREGLQNAVKHAGDAATVRITLAERGGRVEFEVHDNGRGCDLTTAMAGHGYANMADRLAACGGALSIDAAPGAGLRITGWIDQATRQLGRTTSPDPVEHVRPEQLLAAEHRGARRYHRR